VAQARIRCRITAREGLFNNHSNKRGRKGGRWFQNDLTTYYKGDRRFVCQDSRDLMHPLLYIMLWTGALMEQRYLATERIGRIFLNVWPIFVGQMP
jgi:hypothetical protein